MERALAEMSEAEAREEGGEGEAGEAAPLLESSESVGSSDGDDEWEGSGSSARLLGDSDLTSSIDAWEESSSADDGYRRSVNASETDRLLVASYHAFAAEESSHEGEGRPTSVRELDAWEQGQTFAGDGLTSCLCFGCGRYAYVCRLARSYYRFWHKKQLWVCSNTHACVDATFCSFTFGRDSQHITRSVCGLVLPLWLLMWLLYVVAEVLVGLLALVALAVFVIVAPLVVLLVAIALLPLVCVVLVLFYCCTSLFSSSSD